MTMSLDAAAQVMRDAMREKVKRALGTPACGCENVGQQRREHESRHFSTARTK
jgi:hypothetical protein